MQVTHFEAAKAYEAPLHEGVACLRLQGAEATRCDFCAVGLSYYLPAGSAAMSAGPTDKIYVVLEGELTVQVEGGAPQVLGRYDSCHIAAGETREVRNTGNAVATLLVVVANAGPAA
jgi:quercetin dioxygenase-like cupin family protein